MTGSSRLRVGTTALAVVLSAIFTPSLSAAQTTPKLERVGIIRTNPFVHTEISMGDGEGSAFVPRDHSLWLADDNRDSIFEVAPRTGKLKRVIREDAFRSTRRFGGGSFARRSRTSEFESMAYDEVNDALYVFSGEATRPTVFRLTRRAGKLKLDSWQPLDGTSEFTAAGWNPFDHELYVTGGDDLRTYDYRSNALGQPIQITDVTSIRGLSFSGDGSELYAVTGDEVLYAVDWQSKAIIPGWAFDLTPYGVLDGRAVERIGSRFFVLDGGSRPSADRLRAAVFKFDVQQ